MISIRCIGLTRSLLSSRTLLGSTLGGARTAALAHPALRSTAVVPFRTRGIATQKPLAAQEMSEAEELKQLDQQRARRPSSPHLQIYEFQLPWVMSGLHRASGCAIVGGTSLLSRSSYPPSFTLSILSGDWW